jgi:hypothetical protein
MNKEGIGIRKLESEFPQPAIPNSKFQIPNSKFQM